jgi:hypothetical protein
MGFAARLKANSRTTKVEALAARGDVDGLLGLAGHAGPRAGAAAASLLAAMDPHEAAPAVRAALSDRSDRIRCVALKALYEWGDAMSLAEAVFWLPPEGAARGVALAAIAAKLQASPRSISAERVS